MISQVYLPLAYDDVVDDSLSTQVFKETLSLALLTVVTAVLLQVQCTWACTLLSSNSGGTHWLYVHFLRDCSVLMPEGFCEPGIRLPGPGTWRELLPPACSHTLFSLSGTSWL